MHSTASQIVRINDLLVCAEHRLAQAGDNQVMGTTILFECRGVLDDRYGILGAAGDAPKSIAAGAWHSRLDDLLIVLAPDVDCEAAGFASDQTHPAIVQAHRNRLSGVSHQ
jgi:hypothetical protein